MNEIFCLATVEIPPEFTNQTAFLFEIKDRAFIYLGIEPGSIGLVDNSREFSTNFPVAFIFKNETYLGVPELIAEDLYYLENKLEREKMLLFTLPEISLIGHLRGFYRPNKDKTHLLFEKL